MYISALLEFGYIAFESQKQTKFKLSSSYFEMFIKFQQYRNDLEARGNMEERPTIVTKSH